MSKVRTTKTSVLPLTITLPASAGTASVKGGKKRKNRKASGNVSLPAATTRRMFGNTPSISSLGGGDARIRVSHREYVCDVTGSGGFQVGVDKHINPALPESFPWLASLARMYETYQFRQLVFEFVTSTGTGAVGNVMMAVDYDAYDPAPDDKKEFLMQHSCVRTSPWANAQLRCSAPDLAKFGTQRYTRQSGLASDLDVKTYDVGRVFVATSGCAAGSSVGELYVSYVIDLMTPQSPRWDDWASEKITPTEPEPLAPFGNPIEAVVNGNLGVEVLHGDTLRFLRAGSYLVNSTLAGTGISNGNLSIHNSVPPGLVGIVGLANMINASATAANAVARLDIGGPCRAIFGAAASTIDASSYIFTPCSPGLS